MSKNSQNSVMLDKLVHIFDSSSDGLWYMNNDHQIQFYNSTFYEQFDLPLINSSLDDWVKLMHPIDIETFNARVKSHEETKSNRMVSEYRVKCLSGKYKWIEATGIMVTENNETYMVGCHRDITAQKSYNQHLTYVINHEGETGLYNRKKWKEDINACDASSLGVIYTISIEHLYHYQRRWGEKVLQEFKKILEACLQSFLPSDSILYRISPSIFVVWCDVPLSTARCSYIAKNLKNAFSIDSYRDGIISIDDISIGAIHVRDFIGQDPVSLLLKIEEYSRINKTIAMYTGEVKNSIDRYFAVIDALADAIENDEINIALQPIVDANTNKITSFEALARWTHSQLGVVRPDEFISIAEQQGHIASLGFAVLRQSCQFLVNYDLQHADRPLINVNVSVTQLLDGQFVNQVETIVRRIGLKPERIVFEITESHLLDFEQHSVEQLHALHSRGFHLSLDDFGSGFSSLTSLFRLPLLQIKIDKDLVWESLSSNTCRDLILYLVQHSRSNGIQLLAEGVETKEMQDAICNMGVSLLQGFGLYRPATANEWINA